MASPFSVFRSNLKPLMVALTLLSLFAFVALPALQMYQQYNVTSGANQWIARYDGGTFYEDEVAYFNRTHGNTTRFLTAVAEQVIERGGTPRVPGFQRDPRTGQIVAVGISPVNTPQGAVLTKLYANQARELGLTLDDAALEEWMALFTDGKVSRNELAGIRADTTQNLLGQSQLYEHLRTELLAGVFRRVAAAGLEAGPELIVPPTQQWLQFLKLNQEAVVTAYPVMVEEFLDRVSEPTPAEIETIYAEGKDRFSNPNSPEPGFRRRYAANVEFVAANLDDFVQREVAKLSEDEIRAEYERRANEFQLPPTPTQPAEFPIGDTPAEGTPAEDTPAEDTPAEDTPAEGTPAEDIPAEDTPAEEPAAEETPAEEPAAEPGAPAEETPAEQPEADEAGEAGAEPADQPQPSDEQEGAEGAQSRRPTPGAIRLVALRAQDDQPPTSEEPAEGGQEPQTPAEEEAEEPTADQPGADQPAADQPADEQPSEAQPAGESEAEEPPAEQPADEQPAEEQPAEEPTEPARRPFEEVRDQIAESMVRADAREAMERAITEANSLMRTYFSQMAVYQDAVATGRAGERPERPNLQQIAERLGLQYGQTGMQDAVTIQDTAIGRSRGLGASMMGMGQPFSEIVYNDTRPIFAPVQTVNEMEQTTFVSWKTEAREAYVPDLSEIREEVVAAARLSAARKLAQEHAQELAAKANAASDQELEALVPENRRNLIFQDVGPFPWLRSFPGTGIRPFIPDVPELDNVGEKFMRAVFATPVGQYGVGPNNPETVYYVVKPTDIQPPTEELRTRFMQQDQRRGTTELAFQDASQIYGGWATAFEDRIGLEWNEEALQP